MTTPSTEATNFNWLLVNFVKSVPGVRHTLVVSADGLLMAMSDGLGRTAGDQLSAIVSGLAALTGGAARELRGGSVLQAVIEMESAFMFTTTISDGSVLAVVSEASCDVGLIGYEMTVLVNRAEAVMSPELVSEMRAELPLATAGHP
ncbi:MAG: roadblock/LC7 domain-containing protein [Mycobacteriales bacterium]